MLISLYNYDIEVVPKSQEYLVYLQQKGTAHHYNRVYSLSSKVILLHKYHLNSDGIGINCRDTTLYLENLCKRFGYAYNIYYKPNHVYISIQDPTSDEWVIFNIQNERMNIYYERTRQSLSDYPDWISNPNS